MSTLHGRDVADDDQPDRQWKRVYQILTREAASMRQVIPVIIGIVTILDYAARADGLTAFQLQQLMASAATGNTVAVARIGAANGVAGLDAAQHLTNPLTGDVSQ